MVFRQCTVGGILYGNLEDEKDANKSNVDIAATNNNNKKKQNVRKYFYNFYLLKVLFIDSFSI